VAPVGGDLHAFSALAEPAFAFAGEDDPVHIAAIPGLCVPAEALAAIGGAQFELVDPQRESVEGHTLGHGIARGRHAVGREEALGGKVGRPSGRRGIVGLVGDGAVGHCVRGVVQVVSYGVV
jgi:hypothetical protein